MSASTHTQYTPTHTCTPTHTHTQSIYTHTHTHTHRLHLPRTHYTPTHTCTHTHTHTHTEAPSTTYTHTQRPHPPRTHTHTHTHTHGETSSETWDLLSPTATATSTPRLVRQAATRCVQCTTVSLPTTGFCTQRSWGAIGNIQTGQTGDSRAALTNNTAQGSRPLPPPPPPPPPPSLSCARLGKIGLVRRRRLLSFKFIAEYVVSGIVLAEVLEVCVYS